VKKEKNHNR